MGPTQIIVGVFAFTIWFSVFTAVRMKRSNRRDEKTLDAFIEAEREANKTRKKEIDPEYYFTPKLSALPIYNDGSKQEEKALRLAKREMIHFPSRTTNTDLKKKYGPMQLEIITQCEESFNDFISALITLAEFHIENGRTRDALRILEYTLENGSEFRKSYSLSADIYAADNNAAKLDVLLETAETRGFTDEGVKRWIIRSIMEKRNGIGEKA